MEAMAKSWTDERLEERFDRIDHRFDQVDRRFEQIHVDFRELRGEMNSRFDSLQRLIIQMLGTLIVGFVGVIATLATQL
jgi:hypothetical protein